MGGANARSAQRARSELRGARGGRHPAHRRKVREVRRDRERGCEMLASPRGTPVSRSHARDTHAHTHSFLRHGRLFLIESIRYSRDGTERTRTLRRRRPCLGGALGLVDATAAPQGCNTPHTRSVHPRAARRPKKWPSRAPARRPSPRATAPRPARSRRRRRRFRRRSAGCSASTSTTADKGSASRSIPARATAADAVLGGSSCSATR